MMGSPGATHQLYGAGHDSCHLSLPQSGGGARGPQGQCSLWVKGRWSLRG